MNFHTVTTAIALVLGVLMSSISVVEGGKERITHTASDGASDWKFGTIKLNLDRYDDDRNQVYRIVFFKDGVRSLFYFLSDFELKKFTVDDDSYRILYNSDGTIRKLTDLTPDERRELAEEDEQEEGLVEYPRSLSLACEDCYEAWDAFCGEAYGTSNQLYESGLLPEGTTLTAVRYLKTAIYYVCYTAFEAEEGCDGQCV